MRANLSKLQLFGVPNGVRVEVVDEGEIVKRVHGVEISGMVWKMIGLCETRGEMVER